LANLYANHDDQADGLRRIMAGPQPRVFSVLLASSGFDKSRMLINLAVSLQRQGSEVLVINADSRQSMQAYGASSFDTLSAVAVDQASLKEAVRTAGQGFSVAQLMTVKQLRSGLMPDVNQALNNLLANLANRFDVLLVDAELTGEDILPLAMLNEGNNHPDTIKQAYCLIKQVYNQLGCRSFGVLITDVHATEAERLFNHLSQVARRYLSVRLDYMGSIPPDEYFKQASKLGRPVVEVFPRALASTAFKDLAKRFDFGRDACVAG
jgi:flagellar biosynthesis protein FlhG